LGAFVALRSEEDLLKASRTIDEKIADGQDLGLLAGVPIAVKDVDDVRGLPTRAGSYITSPEPALRSSVQVGRLESAGAIVVGKTNVPEFGYSIDAKNRLFGQTRTPLDPTRSSGGSSGGSAAAVSSGMVPLGTGSDGGGSIRIPAAFCGVFGVKPTFGRVPLERDSWGELSHLGALATSVRDLARYLDVVAGPSSADRLSLPEPAGAFEAELEAPDRFRVLASVDLDGHSVVDTVVEQAFREAIEILRFDGFEITWAKSNLIPEVRAAFMDLASYRDGVRLKSFTAEERESLSYGYLKWCELGSAVTTERITAAEEIREELFGQVEKTFDDYDILVTPSVGMLPWIIGAPPTHDPLDVMLTHAFNLTGHPAISIPTQVPMVGLQAVSTRLGEPRLLRFACWAAEALAKMAGGGIRG
jgi:Asp-tRNA(Asn)/Glu-tRNA(Gln) amidotransferase A subunit family amidase